MKTDEFNSKQAEIARKFEDFKSRAFGRSTPEERIKNQIAARERELKEAKRVFSAVYTRGTPEQLEAARQRALELEGKINDLHRVLEGGALKDEADLSLMVEARDLHAEIFEVGAAFRDEANRNLESVFAARAAFLETLKEFGEAIRATAELATLVHQLRRWSGIDSHPASLRPLPLQNQVDQLRVDSQHIWASVGAQGNWVF